MHVHDQVASCTVCPRLCRDVCPVAVHAMRDDFVPSEKMRSVASSLGHPVGAVEPERLLACTDCGACTKRCLLKIPVASLLDGALGRWQAMAGHELPQLDLSAPPIPGHETSSKDEVVVVLQTCVGEPGKGVIGRLPDAGEIEAMAPARSEKTAAGQRSSGGLDHHVPADGSTCCGVRLREGVGDAGLRDRMARAMLADVADGAVVLVGQPICGAHLQQAVGDRLRVRLAHGQGRP